jgi:integrase
VPVLACRRLGLNPETERHKDVWDATVFGGRGTLRFTAISQPWLRQATQDWAHEDLPRRRGNGKTLAVQHHINDMALLSDCLRLQRTDRGDDPSALARVDITNFLNRLAYPQAEGTISGNQRTYATRHVRKVLNKMRALGLANPGRVLAGLPEDFTLIDDDAQAEPEDIQAGRDLPTEVMRHLCAHLDRLDGTKQSLVRVAVALLIDTGRRTDEICQLTLDCLDWDHDGKPVLIYDNIKANRERRRLPIGVATAAVREAQQHRVRERFLSRWTRWPAVSARTWRACRATAVLVVIGIRARWAGSGRSSSFANFRRRLA